MHISKINKEKKLSNENLKTILILTLFGGNETEINNMLGIEKEMQDYNN